jgi:hypothetical protein
VQGAIVENHSRGKLKRQEGLERVFLKMFEFPDGKFLCFRCHDDFLPAGLTTYRVRALTAAGVRPFRFSGRASVRPAGQEVFNVLSENAPVPATNPMSS